MIYSDEELLVQIAANDHSAFSELYDRHWEGLFTTATKALRGKEEAADVVQDVFLSLWNRRDQLQIQGPLPAYLYTSVRYKCIHYIEKNITRRDYIVQLGEVSLDNSPANAEINLHLKEIQKYVNLTVEAMPPKMQTAYKLSRVDHLTHKEIADHMDISVETVKKHIQRALDLIRQALSPLTIISLLILFFCF